MDQRARAIEGLYQQRYARFHGVLSTIAGSYETGHDAVQEAFARALAKRSDCAQTIRSKAGFGGLRSGPRSSFASGASSRRSTAAWIPRWSRMPATQSWPRRSDDSAPGAA
jgi:hypothetical protein